VSPAGEPWDAVVVGAGPAGAVAARELARRGLRVLLADRATFPRGKVCGCCLNGAALSTLAAVGLGDLPAKLGAVPLTRVRIAAGGRGVTLSLPSGVALSREAFDAALIAEAVAAGATFRPGTKAKLEDGETSAGISLQLGDTPVSAKLLIAADGLNGQLTAPAGNTPDIRDGSRIGAGTMAPEGPAEYAPGTIFMATGCGGYVGLVRVEDGRLDVAAAFDPGFVRDAGGPGIAAEIVLGEAGFPAVPGLAALPWKGTPPLTRTARTLAGRRWFAVGDAAGYVEPFTGEGMAWAVASAAAVAPIAAAAARESEWNPGHEAAWAAAHARVVRGRQDLCRATARVLRSPRVTKLTVTALSFAPGLAGLVLARLNRPARPLRPHPEPA
jgi:flavin-dependent dehydrogenase